MYKKNDKSQLKHFDFLIWDSIMLQAAYVISYMLQNGLKNPFMEKMHVQFAVIIGLLYICVGFFCEGYKNILRRGYMAELKSSIKMVTFTVFLMIGYLFLTRNSITYSRFLVSWLWAGGMFLVYIERTVWKSLIRKKMEGTARKRAVVLVSSVSLANETIHSLQQLDNMDFQIIGITLAEEGSYASIAGIPVIGGMEESIEYYSSHVVDEVFIRIPPEQPLPQEFISQCLDMGLAVHLNLEKRLEIHIHQEVQKLGDFTVLTACMSSVTSRQMFVKRLLDIVVSLAGILITAVLTLVVTPIILIQSPGPVFFKQKRVGRGGRTFYIYKFRSMYQNAEECKAALMADNEMDGPIFKIENDPRVFPFGRVMRKWSIDEFPQFFNVLKGDMSLVGTRPPTVDEYQQYQAHHKKRLAAKPGLTGLWQISGRSSIADFEEIVRLDSDYINNWHLGLDIKILFYTVLVVLGKKGAS